jgi:hypothetical protein
LVAGERTISTEPPWSAVNVPRSFEVMWSGLGVGSVVIGLRTRPVGRES